MDAPPEPGIGPATSGRTRWRSVTEQVCGGFHPCCSGTNDRVLAMHLHPSGGHASNEKPRNASARRTDLRQSMPAVVTGILTINALSHDVSVRRKGKRNADKRCSRKPPHLAVRRAPCKARSPIGVPPRLLPKGVIVPKAHPGSGFVRRASRGGFAADASPHSQRAPRAPVIVPAGLIPETPGSGGDEPPPAGTVPRSDQPGSPADVLHGERD